MRDLSKIERHTVSTRDQREQKQEQKQEQKPASKTVTVRKTSGVGKSTFLTNEPQQEESSDADKS